MIPIAVDVGEDPVWVATRAPLRPPAIVSPAPREVSFGRVEGRVSGGTIRVRVFVDGALEGVRDVAGASGFSFTLDLPARDVRIRVVAENAQGDRAGTAVGPVYGLPTEGRPFPLSRSIQDAVLARRVRALTRAYPGIAAAYVQDLRTGRGAAWNARARFPAASTLKLAIAVEVLRRLGGRPPPGTSLYRLLWSMLVYSDNAAANQLLGWIGGSTSGGADRVNALMRSLRIRDSHMYGGYEVLAADAARPIPLQINEQPAFGVGKYTTAWDLARLSRSVHMAARGLGPLRRVEGSFGRADARYLMWVLAHVADHGKLDRFLPTTTSVLHKAGWITYARHDAGLVYWRRGSYAVAVMTWSSSGVGASSDVLAGRIARAAFERFRQLRDQAPAPGAAVLTT